MIRLRQLIPENRYKTKHGSVVRRYHDNVGKQVGSSLYVHKFYADEVIPKKFLTKALEILSKSNPEFAYNCLMWDVKKNLIRFDQAPDFDSAQEPHVGNYIVVSLDGSFPPKQGHSNSIWHHKWLWVKNDYTGFDVDKSKEWSKLWLAKLDEPAKGTDLTWQSQLRKHGLVESVSTKPEVILGAIWPDEEIRAINGYSDDARHPWNWTSCIKWRYVPDIEYLTWWLKPGAHEEMLVKDYLEGKGYKVSRSAVLTIRPFKENKELLMEGKNATYIEAFLKDAIAGTEWQGKVFAVGGFVRDELMGRIPKDIDVVVNDIQGGIKFTIWLAKKYGIYKGPTTPPPTVPAAYKPDQLGRPTFSPEYSADLIKYVEEFDKYYAQFSNPVVFPRFGTAKLALDGITYKGESFDGEDLEAVMPRSEQYNDPNSRKPDVQMSDLKGDAMRRDLTINAIYKDVSTGRIDDPVGGAEDIKNHIIKTPIDPDVIYKDDALRMFRVIRFATQFGWNLSPEVIEGIKRNLTRLRNTSKERVRDELNKILVSKDPARGIRMLKETGLLPYIANELQQAVGMTQNVHHVHDVFDHTLEVLKNTKPELVQRLMALFHDIGKVATRSETPTGVHFYGHEDAGVDIVDTILRSLKYPTEIIDAVKAGVKNHMRLKQGGDNAVKLSDKALRKFKIELGQNLEHTLDVIHADNIAHADASAMPNQIDNVRKRLQALNVQVEKPNLPINGNDLISLGIAKGPMIGKVLAAIADAWFDNPNISREEALAIARTFL